MRGLAFSLVFVASGLSGCFLDRAGSGIVSDRDAGPVDDGGARRDGGSVRDDGATPGMDAGRRDGGRDAGRVDTDRDAGRDAGVSPPTCDSVYGGAPGYVACGMPALGECEFYTVHAASTDSCRSVCMALTGNDSCVRRWREGDPVCMHRDDSPRDCGDTDSGGDDICVCSL